MSRRTGGVAIPLGLFVAIGVALWGWNAWRLLRGRATPAVVVSTGVGESRGRNGTTYHPRVGYRYEVDGEAYEGTRVLAGSGESRGRAWAEAIAARYATGDSTTAYVDPTDPAAAYLVRQPSAAPVLVVALPLAVLGLLALGGASSEHDPLPPPDPAPAGPGSWALAAAHDPARGAGTLAGVVGPWRLAALAVIAAHLGLVLGCAAGEGSVARALGAAWRATLGDGFFVVAAAALGGAGFYLGRRRRAAADTADRVRAARVVVDRDAVRAGTTVDAALRASLLGPRAALRDATLRLERDTRDPRTDKRQQHEAHAPLGAESGPPTAGAPDAMHPATFVLAASSPPSSMRADETPRTTWAFVARLRFVDGHEAELRFPVRVHAAT